METAYDPGSEVEGKVDPGMLPAWGVKDMPEPLPFRMRNIILVVGPGAIALSLSLGGGEWLLGPAFTVKYSVKLLWITLIAVILQAILNMECARYTVATGEPIFSGFMRTRPGPKMWGPFYAILGFLNVGWPAWALASAVTLFAVFMGHLPETAGDMNVVAFLGMGTFITTVLIVMLGGRIERTLEILSIFIILFIFGYLLVLCFCFAAPGLWGKTFLGFFSFGYMPRGDKGIEWSVLVKFAAYSGAGGLGNLWITNWLRDKGFGMGKTVGFIPSMVAGKDIKLPDVGNTFPINDQNVSRWKTWWKYLTVDQGVIFGIGCLLGMFLPVLATNAVIPGGTDITGKAAGSYQAQYFAQAGGAALWFLTLFVCFWAMFGTQLALVDGFTRTVTDILWTASPRIRKWRGGDIRYVYYTLLIIFAVWGCAAMWIRKPFVLLGYGAIAGSVIFVVAGIHVFFVHRKFLPEQLRPPLWRQIVLAACVCFYAFLLVMMIVTL